AFDEHTLSVFDLKEVFYYERAKTWSVEAHAFGRVMICSAHKTALVPHPGQGLEKVIVADFDIRRRCGSGRSAKQNVFGSGLKKIVLNFPGTHGHGATSARNSLRINTSPDASNAVKVRKIRIHNRRISNSVQVQATRGFILC